MVSFKGLKGIAFKVLTCIFNVLGVVITVQEKVVDNYDRVTAFIKNVLVKSLGVEKDVLETIKGILADWIGLPPQVPPTPSS